MKVYVLSIEKDVVGVFSGWREAYRRMISLLAECFVPLTTKPDEVSDCVVWESRSGNRTVKAYIDEHEVDYLID